MQLHPECVTVLSGSWLSVFFMLVKQSFQLNLGTKIRCTKQKSKFVQQKILTELGIRSIHSVLY